MNPKIVFLVVFGCLCALANAQTTSVQVMVQARFSNIICAGGGNGCEPLYCGGTGQSTCASYGLPVPPPAQCRWGTNDGNRSSKSGLGFTAPAQFTTNFNQDFYLGLMTHFNYPISNAASSVRLTLNLTIFSQSGQYLNSQAFAFTLTIDETPNSGSLANCKYPSVQTACADMISYPPGGFDTSSSFIVNDVAYTLQLKGFKESQSSTSLPLDNFVSQEAGKREGYLFARIAAACPNSCVGGGSVYITPDSRCVCNCTTAGACPPLKAHSANCSCQCTNQCQNGGYLRPSDCSCDCATATTCPFPKIHASDCSCVCPPNYCNTGDINPSTCGCTCPPDLTCGPNFNLSSTCLCNCGLICNSPKVRVASPSICDCTCNKTCGPSFSLNNTNCNCDCNVRCPNGQLRIESNCSCGDCVGNWTKDVDGLCTVCGITACEDAGARVDYDACACVCSNLTCNLPQNGEVVDSTKFCSCRPCVAGECVCGNGILEVGEECETPNNITDPCCVACKYTTDPCDDGNGCKDNDICDGAGGCSGTYKCRASSTCSTITCDPSVGICVVDKKPDNTSCPTALGETDDDLCVRRCWDGDCQPYPATGPLAKDCSYDSNPYDCFVPKCVSATGTCELFPVDDNTPCSDGFACTTNDACRNGTCIGTPRTCEDEVNATQCRTPRCIEGGSSYLCKAVPVQNGIRCSDGNNCTLVDICSNGECRSTGLYPRCPTDTTCTIWYCDPGQGMCKPIKFGNETTCNDGRNCTVNDRCLDGVCVGEETDETRALVECGFVPPVPPPGEGDNALIIFAAAGAAALVGAIIGAALIIKKIQNSKLLDPQTWNPDTFSSVGTNPFFQASQKMVDNPLAE